VEWNRGPLGPLAGNPLDDPRTALRVGDVRVMIRDAKNHYTARLVHQGFDARVDKVHGSRIGRGRYHDIWIAVRPGAVESKGGRAGTKSPRLVAAPRRSVRPGP
jgi:hypothetical protein